MPKEKRVRFQNQATRTQVAGAVAVALVAALGGISTGCKKASGGSGADGNVSIPSELQGEWRGGKDGVLLTITSTGSLTTADLICNGTYTLTALSADGPNTWKFKLKDGSENVSGLIKLGADKVLDVSAQASNCRMKGLSGKFKRQDTIAFPEDVRGTWFSCEVEQCSKVKVMFTAKSVVVTGSGGGEECITETATIKDITIDGPISEVRHTGMTSSGWKMGIVKSGDGLDLSGAGTFAGHYTKDECKASPGKAKKPSSDDGKPSRSQGGGASGEKCLTKCGADQNACVLRCNGSKSCITECAAKGQECAGGC